MSGQQQAALHSVGKAGQRHWTCLAGVRDQHPKPDLACKLRGCSTTRPCPLGIASTHPGHCRVPRHSSQKVFGFAYAASRSSPRACAAVQPCNDTSTRPPRCWHAVILGQANHWGRAQFKCTRRLFCSWPNTSSAPSPLKSAVLTTCTVERVDCLIGAVTPSSPSPR